MIRLYKELGSCFRGSIRVGGFENRLFVHGLAIKSFSLSIHFIGRNVDETINVFEILGTFQQNMGTKNIGLGKRKRVTERIVDVGLSCKVHNGVNFVLGENEIDKVATRNISLDKFEVWKIL
jgi:hypothetical protein